MINAVEEFTGQIKQLENFIKILEAEVDRLRTENAELLSKVYGGSTKWFYYSGLEIGLNTLLQIPVKVRVSKAENLVFHPAQGVVVVKIQYKQTGKYFEFWLDGELKEKAAEISTLMQKVRKYKIGFDTGIEKFL